MFYSLNFLFTIFLFLIFSVYAKGDRKEQDEVYDYFQLITKNELSDSIINEPEDSACFLSSQLQMDRVALQAQAISLLLKLRKDELIKIPKEAIEEAFLSDQVDKNSNINCIEKKKDIMNREIQSNLNSNDTTAARLSAVPFRSKKRNMERSIHLLIFFLVKSLLVFFLEFQRLPYMRVFLMQRKKPRYFQKKIINRVWNM